MANRSWLKLQAAHGVRQAALKHPFSWLSQAEGRESEAVGSRADDHRLPLRSGDLKGAPLGRFSGA